MVTKYASKGVKQQEKKFLVAEKSALERLTDRYLNEEYLEWRVNS